MRYGVGCRSSVTSDFTVSPSSISGSGGGSVSGVSGVGGVGLREGRWSEGGARRFMRGCLRSAAADAIRGLEYLLPIERQNSPVFINLIEIKLKSVIELLMY